MLHLWEAFLIRSAHEHCVWAAKRGGLTGASLALHVGGDFCWCGSPPLWAMVCRAQLRACPTPIAHGVGSHKDSSSPTGWAPAQKPSLTCYSRLHGACPLRARFGIFLMSFI